MKVIDLLNKIAKGEEVPKKIKYLDKLWFYNDDDYADCDMQMCLFGDYIDKNYYIIEVLNDEVEIIEEDKKIEKIKITYEDDTYKLLLDDEDVEDGQREILACKVNELIDEVNKLKGGKNE